MHSRTSRLNQSARQHLATGFTAIELMVVVAIVAVLAALAGPSFGDLIDGWRVRSTAESLTSTIYYARSEAIKRGGRVSVRKNCTTGTNQEWQCGWIVFTDFNSNGALDTGGANPDVILQSFPKARSVNVNNLNNRDNFILDRWGQINGLGAGGFSLTPEALGAASRHASALCISSGGRVRMLKDTVSCP